MSQHRKRTMHTPLDERDPRTVRSVILARESDPNSKAPPLESQVAECEKFIARMGWPKPTIGPFLERASGYYHVERPVLDAVESLIQRREVDVVVCLNWERLARVEERRYASLYLARKYGAEFRFAELLPDGKRDESPMAKAYGSLLQVFGELERNKIVERTKRGREHHAAYGKPRSGRGGPPYGLRVATAADVYSVHARDDTEAERLLWMFERFDADERVSTRGLAGELNGRNWLTREGKHWTSTTVRDKLTNPRYAGRGRLNRWEVTWVAKQYADTGETYDVRTVTARDPEQTLPMAPNSEPVLIPPDLFDRVQRKLDERHDSAGKLARARSPHPVEATLLHGGIVRCAHCGESMLRYWRHSRTSKSHATPEDAVPYYRCGARRRDPTHPCRFHQIPAAEVDLLVTRLLAEAITMPAYTLKLADAADAQLARVHSDAEVSGTRLDAYREALSEVDDDAARYRRVLAVLDPHKDGDTIAEYRGKLAQLDERRARLEQEAAAAAPRHQRARDREMMLEMLRGGKMLLAYRDETSGAFVPITALKLWDARRLLGLPSLGTLYNKRRIAAGVDALPELDAEWNARNDLVTEYEMDSDDDPDAAPIIVGSDSVSMADVAMHLLRHVMPHAEVRRLLRSLQAVVEVSRPRARSERATPGEHTPVNARVSLLLLAERSTNGGMRDTTGDGTVGLRLQAGTVAAALGRADANNSTQFQGGLGTLTVARETTSNPGGTPFRSVDVHFKNITQMAIVWQ